MIKNLKRIKELHNRVIHIEKAKASVKATNAEDRYVKAIDYNELNLVCKECFSDPN
jgi:hypothetical protein